MRTALKPLTIALGLAAAPFVSFGQTAYTATLAGHAVLPAQTMIPAPKGSPADLQVSGKFRFFTIENVDIVDKRHIVVGNDNNLPFSSSRHPNQADDNELVLLEVEQFLQAR
jgi:hypothetical protein